VSQTDLMCFKAVKDSKGTKMFEMFGD